MRKIFYLLMTLCLSFSNIACHQSGHAEFKVFSDSLFQVVTIDPDAFSRTERSKISDIAEGIEYIPLQTVDSVLIGSIEKMIVWKNDFYIWDRQTESVFIFGSDGSFKYKLSKQGSGPEEYPRIYDFEVDRQTGNILIYSDRSRKFYEYTAEGYFVSSMKSPVMLASFASCGDWKYCYLGRSSNEKYYEDVYPQLCRYMALYDGHPQQEALPYEYQEEITRVPLSSDNYSFYNDTVLLTEFLKPMVYSVDSGGQLHPKYRLEFTTNTYGMSFDEPIDLKKMKAAQKAGEYTTLFGTFFETDQYIFFNYARGLIGSGYVDKRTGIVHNQGYFIEDDFNVIGLSSVISFVDGECMYKKVEPSLLLKNRANLSPYLETVCQNMQEYDNPVIVRIKLKK